MEVKKTHTPLATFFITLLLSPFGGMLYLGRGWWALFYLFAPMLAGAGLNLTAAAEHNDLASSIMQIITISWLFYLVGLVHCTIIAARKSAIPDKWYSKWWVVVVTVLVVQISLGLAFRAYVYRAFDIPSRSMEPTLHKGDYFIAQRFGKNNIQRGDIIVFEHSAPHKAYYVKRIIGMPGDQVEYKNGNFFINGKQIQQTHIGANPYTENLPNGASYSIMIDGNNPLALPDRSITLDQNSYFVVGDNRTNSMDSGFPEFGYVGKSEVVGKVVIDFYADEIGLYHAKTF